MSAFRDALDDLQQAEAEYRLMHDRHGDGSQAAGRAWDQLRRCGDNARAILAIADTHPEDGDVQQAPLVSGGGARSAIARRKP